jgi:membrane protease YdiL (CAAX protease family)
VADGHGRLSLPGFLRNHPLTSFFLLAFAIAWAILIPNVLASYGLITMPASAVLLLVMGYGPTIAALIVSGALGGGTEIRRLLGRLLIWRVGWGWWAITLFGNGAIILAALGLYALLGNEVPAFPALGPGLLVDIVLTFLLVAVINGEEIGWRGFALPRLQARYGVPTTVAVLGVLETLFHLPIFFNNGPSDAGGQNGTPFVAFLFSSVLAVFLFVWLYDHTRGSLLIATFFHASMNAWSNVLPFPATSASFFWLLVLAQLAAVAVVLVIGGTGWMQVRPGGANRLAAVEGLAGPTVLPWLACRIDWTDGSRL